MKVCCDRIKKIKNKNKFEQENENKRKKEFTLIYTL